MYGRVYIVVELGGSRQTSATTTVIIWPLLLQLVIRRSFVHLSILVYSAPVFRYMAEIFFLLLLLFSCSGA